MKPLPWLLLIGVAWLSGCRQTGEIRPAHIFPDAHSSGHLVRIGADSRVAVSGGMDGSIRLWRLRDGTPLAVWQGHEGPVQGLLLVSGEDYLVSAGNDGELKQWNYAGGLVRRLSLDSRVTALTGDPDGQLMLTGHADGSVRVWTLPGFGERKRFPVADGRIEALALHVPGGRIAAADDNGGVWYWSLEEIPERIADLRVYLRTLAFDGTASRLFGGSWFNLYRWDLGSGELDVLDTDHRGIIADLAWSDTTGDLYSISRQTDSSVLQLDPGTGATRNDFGKHDLCGASVDVSADGRYLITTSDDASVRIWRLR